MNIKYDEKAGGIICEHEGKVINLDLVKTQPAKCTTCEHSCYFWGKDKEGNITHRFKV